MKSFLKQITHLLFIIIFGTQNVALCQESIVKNPIAPIGNDPWVIQKDGVYYYCYSQGGLKINKSRKLQDVLQMKGKQVWAPPSGQPYSKEIWAPELHFLQGKWYIYFAADDGQNRNHRMYVLESKTEDPLGEYTFAGKLSDASDKWAIDGTVLEHKDRLYFIWSGWQGNEDVQQNLYIARMKDPKTIFGNRMLISKPEYDWEKIGKPLINEGPQVLKNKESVFIIYSASGSWTDDYCLGQLKLTGDNPLDPQSWTKSRTPVFSGTGTVFSPGHASFVKSPDGEEDWIVYHTAKHKGAKWNRDANIKKFTWDIDGNPIFGYPESKGVDIPAPGN